MMVTRQEFESLRLIVKELVETNKKQLEYAKSQQTQINMLNEAIGILRKLTLNV